MDTVIWTSPLQANHSKRLQQSHRINHFMSKRKNNAIKSPPVIVHTTHAPSPLSPDGHLVYPDLVRPQTRLESLSRTARSLISSFAPSTPPNPQSLPSSSTGPAHQRSYGSYASTADSPGIPEESTRVNAITWSNWASVHNRTLLLVAYEQSGFHIWDFTQLDNAKEVLHLTSIGPVISATIQSSPSSQSIRKPPTLFLLTGSGEDATLCVYSLALHAFLKRINVPNARTVQGNERFIVVGAASASGHRSPSNDTTSPAIHVLEASGEYAHLHTIPASSISPHTLSPVFSLSSSRLLAYASSEPPVHLQTKTLPSSYPPSNPFTPLPSPSGGSSSNFTAGLSVVGSTMLTGAMRLGTGVLEGVKMGISAAGYGSDHVPVRGQGDEREDVRRTVSRSAPAPHVSPLVARGHSRRASAQVRPAVSSGAPGGHPSGTDGGEWITILDLQPLLDGTRATDTEPTIHSPLSPSSSFLIASPPLTHLVPPSIDARTPDIVVEFPYTSSSSTKVESQPHIRSSPSKYGSPSRLSPSHPSTPNAVSKAIASAKWSPDGTMLAVGGADGGSVRTFGISRGKRVSTVDSEKARPDERKGEAKLVYELMRGVTPASIQDIRWSADGLWCGFVSDKGTLHIYALNPQGGEIDGTSQIYGRVLNSAKRPLPTTRVQALARLRQPLFGMDQEDLLGQQGRAPTDVPSDSNPFTLPIFIFIPAKSSRSSSRLPTPPEQRSPSTSLSTTEADAATSGENPATGFNDTLVFLPEEGRAVLWRCTLHPASSSAPGTKIPATRRIEPSPSIMGDAHAYPTGATGLPSSLPIGGGVLSGVARITGLGEGGLKSALTRGSRLVVESAVLASWDMRRGDTWPEVKSAVWGERSAPLDETSRQSYVSHAELTTFHLKSSAVSRPIYLSHQFNFFSLMNDYQALVRRLVLDPPTFPVAMRKESVVVRGGDDLLSLHPHDSRISLPGEFDSDANFLGAATSMNMGPLDLADSPLLGGHLGLPMEGVPVSSSLASTNVTSHSSQSRNGRRIVGKSFDDGLSSAMESRLQLHASYSPSGSSSDVVSPGRVIPMLPNGRPGSSGSGVTAGLDAVVRSTTRVGKEVWSGLGNVRSPRLMPTKRSSTSADLLKFDEEDEMFMVDGLEEAGVIEGARNQEALGVSGAGREGSLATLGPGIGIRYPLSGMTDSGLTVIGPQTGATLASTPGEEGTWVEQPEVYAQAVEEDARFDDVTKVLEEEREERRAIHGAGAGPASMSSSMVSESGKGKRKGGKKKRR